MGDPSCRELLIRPPDNALFQEMAVGPPLGTQEKKKDRCLGGSIHLNVSSGSVFVSCINFIRKLNIKVGFSCTH
ncbi:hypothetical protein Y032_0032g2607 [Ancylostoma ceylanicum]|uniref:Uncharacterized protein n=1 Tax=Ancylostoma ceylanicum TaxID=53326 RepID=A0A016UR80_9BILA|nr:hypothetical protein Y032_0032g2607 [Ancylostoma ceylanicum]